MLFAQLFHQGTDLDDLFRVETNGRFVQDQNRRIVDERLCQTHTLPVTFGQVLDDSAGNVADPAEIADVLQMRAPWQLALFQVIDKVQIAHDGHIQVQRRQLRQIADLCLCLDRIFQNVDAVNQCLSGCGADIAGEHIHGGGLSGAVRSQKSQDLTVLYGKADVVDRQLIPVLFRQMFDFNHPCDCLLLLYAEPAVSPKRKNPGAPAHKN